jgi:predicted ATPase
MLLVLDNCEHVIAASAALAEQIFHEAPEVHILATSREALRVDGEFTYLLPPLECPPPDPGLRAIEALGGKFDLPKLASMKSAAAKQTLTQSLDGLIKDAGGCPQSDAAR